MIPGSGRSPGEGTGCPLQHSGLENPMDCMAHGVAKSRTRLNQLSTHTDACEVVPHCGFILHLPENY